MSAQGCKPTAVNQRFHHQCLTKQVDQRTACIDRQNDEQRVYWLSYMVLRMKHPRPQHSYDRRCLVNAVNSQRCRSNPIQKRNCSQMPTSKAKEKGQCTKNIGRRPKSCTVIFQILYDLTAHSEVLRPSPGQSKQYDKDNCQYSRRLRIQHPCQAVARKPTHIPNQQIKVKKSPKGVRKDTILCKQGGVPNQKHPGHNQQPAQRTAWCLPQQKIEHRSTKQHHQILGNKPKLLCADRKRSPAKASQAEIFPRQSRTEQGKWKCIQPHPQPERKKTLAAKRLPTKEPSPQHNKQVASQPRARPQGGIEQCQWKRIGYSCTTLTCIVICHNKEHAQDPQQFQTAFSLCR